MVYFALFIFNGVTRTGRFSPDSMNYVNVAQNILAGKGITQPTLGFNQPDFSLEEGPPIPLTAQAPLYPILISLVSHVGISSANGALLLAAIAMMAIFLLVYRLATDLYDAEVGLAAAALLLVYHPMRWMAGWAWNDPIGVALVLVALWLLAKNRRYENVATVAIAGLVTGIAFATRFALLPLFAIGVLSLLLNIRPRKPRLIEIAAYTIGFALPFGIVCVRNFILTRSFSPPFNPARVAVPENVKIVSRTVFGDYAQVLSVEHQVWLLCLSLIAICIVLALRREFGRGLASIFFLQGRWILTIWSVGYLVFLIIQRSRSYFDVDARTIAPAGIILVILWTAALLRAARPPSAVVASFALALLLLATWREGRAAHHHSVLDLERTVKQSERLTWLAERTSNDDLIIGDDVVDVPFFLHRPFTLSFSPYPYTNFPAYDKIMTYSRIHCREYRNIFLVLRRNATSEEDWRYAFGDFFADLMAGKVEKYPGLVPLEPLNDALIFQVSCR